MAQVGYNPNDPVQQAFLAALAQGETGGSAGSLTEGVGGANLAGVPTDQYGFPQWSGLGNSHAAGTFQFQPSTWDSIAQEYGLNFSHPEDQAAGAWYYAQQTDPNIYSELQAGSFSKIQTALAGVWPSVTGNGAAPQGLAADIQSNLDQNTAQQNMETERNNAATAMGGGNSIASPATGTSPALAWLGGTFAQGALIVVGAVIVFVALWQLLSTQGWVPSPKQAVRAAF